MKKIFFLFLIIFASNNFGMHRHRKRSIHRPASDWVSPTQRLQELLDDGFSRQGVGIRAARTIISLVREGANANTGSDIGSTALMLVCSNKLNIDVSRRKDLINSLLWHDAKVNQLNGADESALTYAVRADDYETIGILLENGAILNIKQKISGWTLLMYAIQKRDGEEWIMEQFLERGAIVSLCNNIGRTALHIAADENKQNKARLLLKYNADPNQKDNLGNSPLMVAESKGHLLMSALLLNDGADPSQKNNAGQSFVDLAKDKPKMKALLSLQKIP